MANFTEEQAAKLLKRAERFKYLPTANSARSLPTQGVPPIWPTENVSLVHKPKKAKPIAVPKVASAIEEQFALQIEQTGLPTPERQHRYMFARKFMADFAWPHLKFAVEVQGQCHRIEGRFKSDIERSALLLLDGWTILEVGGDEIRNGIAVKWTAAMLKIMEARHAG